MKLFVLSVSLAVAAVALVPQRQHVATRQVSRPFFEQFIPDAGADEQLDKLVSKAKAVLLTDGGGSSETVKAALKGAKLSTFTEVNLKSEPNSAKLLGSLKRRVGVNAPVLIVAGQVFDAERIQYLCRQDMMLPVFRAAGTSGEIRLPFQDLRFYLSKTIR